MIVYPAFSLILFTTLIGVGQGLFLALFAGQLCMTLQLLPAPDGAGLFGVGSILVVAILLAGLAASVFHLTYPVRAWRAAFKWRTCWLSREVIALPIVMILAGVYGAIHLLGRDVVLLSISSGTAITSSLFVGSLGALGVIILFLCTAMIYTEVAFLREWASPLTFINFLLLGTASGFTLATVFSMYTAPELIYFYGAGAFLFGAMAFVSRSASVLRSARIHAQSTMSPVAGGSYEEDEEPELMGMSVTWVKRLFPVLVFVLPGILLYIGMSGGNAGILLAAFVVQFGGLIMERWFFFVQVRHPGDAYRLPVFSVS